MHFCSALLLNQRMFGTTAWIGVDYSDPHLSASVATVLEYTSDYLILTDVNFKLYLNITHETCQEVCSRYFIVIFEAILTNRNMGWYIMVFDIQLSSNVTNTRKIINKNN